MRGSSSIERNTSVSPAKSENTHYYDLMPTNNSPSLARKIASSSARPSAVFHHDSVLTFVRKVKTKNLLSSVLYFFNSHYTRVKDTLSSISPTFGPKVRKGHSQWHLAPHKEATYDNAPRICTPRIRSVPSTKNLTRHLGLRFVLDHEFTKREPAVFIPHSLLQLLFRVADPRHLRMSTIGIVS